MHALSPLDWTICVGYLIVVFAMGAWFARGQHSNEEYFVGGRRMNWMAVGLSLFAGVFSSLSFVGLPRSAAYGDYHLYLAILFIPVFVTPIVWVLFVPLYHRLRLTSAYEYLELRFHRGIRLLGSALYSLYTIGWVGTMLYAVGVILDAVLDLSEAQLVWTLIGIGLFATVYTTLGGVRAVVWTDVLQVVTLGGGMLVVLLLIVHRIDGGWSTLWELGHAHGKFEMFDFRWDMSENDRFYSACAYGIFVYLAAFSVSQGAVQRYVAMPTVAAARRALVVNGLMIGGVCLLFFSVGSALFAFYHQDLPAGGTPGSGFPPVAREDHLVAYFVQTEVPRYGLTGLLLAGLFAAAMSSVDSGINSLTALTVCDWLGGRHLGVGFSRALCFGFGIVVTLAALLVGSIGEHVFDIIMKIAGTFFGPLLAVFLLGILTRRANTGGAVIGFVAGAIGLALVLPTAISHWWYGAVTFLPTFTVGFIASFVFPSPPEERLDGLVVGRLRRTVRRRTAE